MDNSIEMKDRGSEPTPEQVDRILARAEAIKGRQRLAWRASLALVLLVALVGVGAIVRGRAGTEGGGQEWADQASPESLDSDTGEPLVPEVTESLGPDGESVTQYDLHSWFGPSDVAISCEMASQRVDVTFENLGEAPMDVIEAKIGSTESLEDFTGEYPSIGTALADGSPASPGGSVHVTALASGSYAGGATVVVSIKYPEPGRGAFTTNVALVDLPGACG